MNTKVAFVLLAITTLLAACSNSQSTNPFDVLPVEPDNTGILAIQLEPIDGIFVEGFEIGIRVEDATGNTAHSGLWSDFIIDSGRDSDIAGFYDSVFKKKMPAGDYTIHTTLNVGAGPGPEIPDLTGDMDCTLPITVSDAGQTTVEVALSSDQQCLTLIN